MRPSESPSALAAAVLAAALCLGPLPAAAQDTVMAKVNGKDITEADLALANAEIGRDLGNLPAATKRRVLVEFLIETHLFAGAAEAERLSAGPEFDKRLGYWRQRALRDAFFEKNVQGLISETLAKSIFEDKVKMLPPEEEVQARHILVDTEVKAKELAEKIAGGGDFAQLAKENSQDPGSKDEGGMLGYFGRGQMVPQFERAAFGLKIGELSAPVKSQFGWHLIKLENRRQKPPPTFDEVKDRLIGSMVQSKAQDIAGQLREKAKIEYIDLEVKKLVEEDAKKAEAQKKAFGAQIDKMEAQEKK
ncbi:MAG TPA: peptidylprolyl isomerase [Hyphomicrobiaceae bacterium]|nr:peptidylprolyl isomerase [Hyphomicrobiaceae bacterium]